MLVEVYAMKNVQGGIQTFHTITTGWWYIGCNLVLIQFRYVTNRKWWLLIELKICSAQQKQDNNPLKKLSLNCAKTKAAKIAMCCLAFTTWDMEGKGGIL